MKRGPDELARNGTLSLTAKFSVDAAGVAPVAIVAQFCFLIHPVGI